MAADASKLKVSFKEADELIDLIAKVEIWVTKVETFLQDKGSVQLNEARHLEKREKFKSLLDRAKVLKLSE